MVLLFQLKKKEYNSQLQRVMKQQRNQYGWVILECNLSKKRMKNRKNNKKNKKQRKKQMKKHPQILLSCSLLNNKKKNK